MNRQSLSILGFIAGVILLLVNLGVINPDNILPDNPVPTPVDPTPIDPTPDDTTKILLAIEAEGFPELPPSLEKISEPIRDILVQCNNLPGSLILARFFADWSDCITLPSSAQINTYGKFQIHLKEVLTFMLVRNRITTICPGISDAISKVILPQPVSPDQQLTETDRQQIALAFQAISARSYEAFRILTKQTSLPPSLPE